MNAASPGPDGCNLFIFHLPNGLTNVGLYTLFAAFGTVVSARIMVENDTGRSRGFGFVSFDNRDSAMTAIKTMNGFQIGHKRLKVQFKTSPKFRTPHAHGGGGGMGGGNRGGHHGHGGGYGGGQGGGSRRNKGKKGNRGRDSRSPPRDNDGQPRGGYRNRNQQASPNYSTEYATEYDAAAGSAEAFQQAQQQQQQPSSQPPQQQQQQQVPMSGYGEQSGGAATNGGGGIYKERIESSMLEAAFDNLHF